MSSPAINVSNLGKKYVISHQRERGYKNYKSLREEIADAALTPWRALRGSLSGKFKSKSEASTSTLNLNSPASREDFWALRDVSFSIQQGEAVGIIGRNGAGKSTLLKLLSRITEPSQGRIELNGRVASLLEVGTGFHPELTGRENIYLNGAILGMSRAEIKRKFDEIVAFAEVEKFLDTPVKRYSSGMYVRLAFAVAAHLEPEILIVDEVLAVGDVEFQRKCLGKMQDVSQKDGRTVLFVSHNMTAIENLTQRCLFVKSGRIEFDGGTAECVSRYLRAGDEFDLKSLAQHKNRTGSGAAKFSSVEICDLEGKSRTVFRPTEPIVVKLVLDLQKELMVDVALVVENEKEQPLFCSHLSDSREPARVEGRCEFSTVITPNHLRSGKYRFSLAAFHPNFADFYDTVLHCPGFEIEGQGVHWNVPADPRWGNLYFDLKWEVK